MGQIEELKKELAGLKAKQMNDQEIKKLKAQIKGAKFGATRGGKIFNKIADIGEAGRKYLATPLPQQTAGKKKKKKKSSFNPDPLKDLLRNLPQ